MNNNNNANTRIIVAVVLSLVFLIPYMYFFAPKTTANNSHNATIANNTSVIIDSTPTAPNNANADIQAPINTNTSNIIATIESNSIKITIDDLGRIDNVLLKDKKYQDNNEPLALFDSKSIKPLEIRFQDINTNNNAFRTPYTASSANLDLDSADSVTLTLTQDLGDLVVKKILTFHNNFEYDVNIELSKPTPYYISNGAHPIADTSTYAFKGVIIKKDDDKIEKIADGKAKIGENPVFNKAKFVASVDRYYATIFFNESGLNIITDADSNENALPYIALDNNATFSGYIGPKNHKDLRNISPMLTDSVEYGIITFFAKPLFLLLNWLFGICNNWGWAIILLTLIVRIVLYPLTYKGMVSMQRLKDLAPKMKEIQTKYKDDKQKLQIHMMELYKKHKVNPMGGCLPLLLQIPVFFAIYRVLYNAVELKDSAWLLWINDLSAMDPYFILPILMGGSMYLQQHLSPATFNDPMQEKIFKFLPIIFTIFLITFPSGLILYWTVNNIFSIIQQLIINKVMKKKKEIEALE